MGGVRPNDVEGAEISRPYLAHGTEAAVLAPPRGVATLLADALVAVVDADGLVLGRAQPAHELAPVVLAHLRPALCTVAQTGIDAAGPAMWAGGLGSFAPRLGEPWEVLEVLVRAVVALCRLPALVALVWRSLRACLGLLGLTGAPASPR